MGTWSYSYDNLNRLAGATASQPGNPNTNYCWGYDSFGNRLVQAGSSQPFASGSPNCAPAGNGSYSGTWTAQSPDSNNRLAATSQSPGGVAYDAAGDMLTDGVNQYLYDAEGRVCAVASTPVPGMTILTGYIYDADGNRVAKGTIQTWGSCDPTVNGFLAGGNETDYVLGPGGEQVTELAQDANGSMNWQRTYVYAAGSLIATYNPAPNPQFNQAQYNPSTPTVDPPSLAMPSFRLTDWLGTMRATTDAWGVVQSTCTGLPFGDGVACSGDIPDPHHFTGKERDTESGNDYFGARYYSSSMGRFLSPDWSGDPDPVPYAELDKPQSLNLYSYVENNPLRSTDPDGHMHEECAKSTTSTQDADGTIHMTVSEHCQVVADVGDNWEKRSTIPIMNWMQRHPVLTSVLAGPPCTDPKGCIQSGVMPWGMTGGLSGGSILKILEQDADAIHAVIQTSKGPIEVMANMTKEGDKLVLKEVHVGEGVRLTNGEIRQAARELGRQEGVSTVEIQGRVRTGGANPGQRPQPFTVKVN
jgi:RHS repeat-associated protein